MHRSLPILVVSLLALSASLPAVAQAASGQSAGVEVAVRDPADSCGARSVEVARWTPALGPAARFIAGSPARFIALGRTDQGFWSSQWTTPSDACDDCGYVDLVFTRFADGHSTRYPVLREADRSAFDGEPDAGTAEWMTRRNVALEKIMLSRLWGYAATVWPVATLRHDYAVVTPPMAPPADALPGTPALYRGWLIGVVQAGRWRLRFTTDMGHLMCWCTESWRAFAPEA